MLRFSRRSRSTFFFSRSRFLKSRFLKSRFLKSRFLSRDFDASRFLSRCVKIVEIFRDAVEICREILTLSKPVESENDEKSWRIEKSRHCQSLLSLKMMKSLDGLRNLDEKIQKSTHFSIEIKTNCREMPKFSDLDEFLDLDRDFLVWTLMSRRNREVSIEISRSSRLSFWRRQDFLDCRDSLFDDVEIETTSRQIETPRVTKKPYTNILGRNTMTTQFFLNIHNIVTMPPSQSTLARN